MSERNARKIDLALRVLVVSGFLCAKRMGERGESEKTPQNFWKGHKTPSLHVVAVVWCSSVSRMGDRVFYSSWACRNPTFYRTASATSGPFTFDTLNRCDWSKSSLTNVAGQGTTASELSKPVKGVDILGLDICSLRLRCTVYNIISCSMASRIPPYSQK